MTPSTSNTTANRLSQHYCRVSTTCAFHAFLQAENWLKSNYYAQGIISSMDVRQALAKTGYSRAFPVKYRTQRKAPSGVSQRRRILMNFSTLAMISFEEVSESSLERRAFEINVR